VNAYISICVHVCTGCVGGERGIRSIRLIRLWPSLVLQSRELEFAPTYEEVAAAVAAALKESPSANEDELVIKFKVRMCLYPVFEILLFVVVVFRISTGQSHFSFVGVFQGFHGRHPDPQFAFDSNQFNGFTELVRTPRTVNARSSVIVFPAFVAIITLVSFSNAQPLAFLERLDRWNSQLSAPDLRAWKSANKQGDCGRRAANMIVLQHMLQHGFVYEAHNNRGEYWAYKTLVPTIAAATTTSQTMSASDLEDEELLGTRKRKLAEPTVTQATTAALPATTATMTKQELFQLARSLKIPCDRRTPLAQLQRLISAQLL
jgi:hypothetical protein